MGSVAHKMLYRPTHLARRRGVSLLVSSAPPPRGRGDEVATQLVCLAREELTGLLELRPLPPWNKAEINNYIVSHTHHMYIVYMYYMYLQLSPL